eukprot:12002282-Alexandrium_andersonii.AAC.1
MFLQPAFPISSLGALEWEQAYNHCSMEMPSVFSRLFSSAPDRIHGNTEGLQAFAEVRFVRGSVSQLTRCGALVTVDHPSERAFACGLVHASEFCDEELKVGLEVYVRVVSVEPGRNRL